MKLLYFKDTDTLYIGLREGPASETEEIAYNVLVDYNAEHEVVGITLDGASQRTDLQRVEVEDLPSVLVHTAGPQVVEAP